MAKAPRSRTNTGTGTDCSPEVTGDLLVDTGDQDVGRLHHRLLLPVRLPMRQQQQLFRSTGMLNSGSLAAWCSSVVNQGHVPRLEELESMQSSPNFHRSGPILRHLVHTVLYNKRWRSTASSKSDSQRAATELPPIVDAPLVGSARARLAPSSSLQLGDELDEALTQPDEAVFAQTPAQKAPPVVRPARRRGPAPVAATRAAATSSSCGANASLRPQLNSAANSTRLSPRELEATLTLLASCPYDLAKCPHAADCFSGLAGLLAQVRSDQAQVHLLTVVASFPQIFNLRPCLPALVPHLPGMWDLGWRGPGPPSRAVRAVRACKLGDLSLGHLALPLAHACLTGPDLFWEGGLHLLLYLLCHLHTYPEQDCFAQSLALSALFASPSARLHGSSGAQTAAGVASTICPAAGLPLLPGLLSSFLPGHSLRFSCLAANRVAFWKLVRPGGSQSAAAAAGPLCPSQSSQALPSALLAAWIEQLVNVAAKLRD
uniref:RAP domain-containing protein n=1 Tax=Macrostomum lignano TaxID=282301 RepID=A0A1I8FKR7_9PLAT